MSYETIQEAIDASETENGHVILVKKGVYYENASTYACVIINKTLTFIGEERNNTIIDGMEKEHVILVIAENVTITGFTIMNSRPWYPGLIYPLYLPSGVWIYSKDRCNITQNNIVDNGCGIWFSNSSNNSVSENEIAKNSFGIYVDDPYNNGIYKNNVTANNEAGIHLGSSSYNDIFGNDITNNRDYGISLYSSNHNNIAGNNVTGSKYFGISLSGSSDNMLRSNIMIGNGYNFHASGINDVDASNTVDGKPIYYWINRRYETVPLDAGYVALVNCTNIIAKNLTLAKNFNGILLAYTNHTIISGNNITNNYHGIGLFKSSNNTIYRNNITNNEYGLEIRYSSRNSISANNVIANKGFGVWVWSSSDTAILGNNITAHIWDGISIGNSSYNTVSENNIVNNRHGVELSYYSNNNTVSGNNVTANYKYGIAIDLYTYPTSSSNNVIYHNNFIDNTKHVYSNNLTNVWDDCYPSGGNYWSDYTGSDMYSGVNQNETGHDWIGDSPYIINGNNIDRYPLMYPFVLEMEEIRIAYRNLLLKYSALLYDFETLNLTLYILLNNMTELREQIDAINSTFQMLIDDLKNRVDLLNSTLQMSVGKLQGQYNSLNSTLTSGQQTITNELVTLRNLMYFLIATTIILIVTTVYSAIRKPKARTRATRKT